jgi:hypothetical protein
MRWEHDYELLVDTAFEGDDCGQGTILALSVQTGKCEKTQVMYSK